MTIKERQELETRANILGRIQCASSTVSSVARTLVSQMETGAIGDDEGRLVYEDLRVACIALMQAMQKTQQIRATKRQPHEVNVVPLPHYSDATV